MHDVVDLADSPIRRLYEWDELLQFVAAIVERDVMNPYLSSSNAPARERKP